MAQVGDLVKILSTSLGARGAIGATGVVVSDDTPILSGIRFGPKVRLNYGDVWGLGQDAVLEVVQSYRDTVTHLEDGAGKKTSVPLPLVGPGGAPTRATILPTAAAERKKFPVATGFLDYFPDAVAAVANLSYVGNEQHNPGQSLRWDRAKSQDESDTMLRHFLQRGTLDSDGVRHTVKMAWRAMALLQKELESVTHASAV